MKREREECSLDAMKQIRDKRSKQIARDHYVEKLVDRMHNGMIKIVSGIRRSGKSYLLYNLFRRELEKMGVEPSHIITVALDELKGAKYRNPTVFYDYIKTRVRGKKMHYLLLDEVQMMKDFESVLNGLLRLDNLDVYVTGSNSRFLSTDVVTEFRGRGDEVRVFPLSFSEFYAARGGEWSDAWEEYRLYGGMPQLFAYEKESDKIEYLNKLFQETYIKDILERNRIKNNEELNELLNITASDIGCLLNPHKLANSFRSLKKINISEPTIALYLNYLQDAFIIHRAMRFDIKGNRYINTPSKYYFTDIGLRNARLNFRQIEEGHAMENIIYNELLMRGYQVDVGSLDILEKDGRGDYVRKRTEVDFVVNLGSKRYYIQSAAAIPTREKREQEERSLLAIRDSFKKILISASASSPHYDDAGVLILSIKDFLLNPTSLME